MRVTMLVDITGTRDGQDWPERGAVIDLSKDEAEHLIAGGLAEPVGKKDAPESAAVAPDETAAVTTTRKRGAVK